MGLCETFSDEKLLSLLKDNDESAFTELFKRHWQGLYEKADTILNNSHYSKDIVQEVFFSLWNRRSHIEIQSVKAYLEQATRFQVFKAIRDRKTSLDFRNKLAAVTADLIEDNPMIFKEHLELLDYLIHHLPEDCRAIFSLSRQSQMTYKEIASLLQISEKVVERKIAKALSYLRSNFRYELGIWLFIMAVWPLK